MLKDDDADDADDDGDDDNGDGVHLLVADVLEAFPHPLHLVAQLVLLLQRVHPLLQVHLVGKTG